MLCIYGRLFQYVCHLHCHVRIVYHVILIRTFPSENTRRPSSYASLRPRRPSPPSGHSAADCSPKCRSTRTIRQFPCQTPLQQHRDRSLKAGIAMLLTNNMLGPQSLTLPCRPIDSISAAALRGLPLSSPLRDTEWNALKESVVCPPRPLLPSSHLFLPLHYIHAEHSPSSRITSHQRLFH